MVLSKCFKTKPWKGLKVEIQILDNNGRPQDFCADHDVFAVEPGPFVIDMVVTGAASLLADLNRHSVRDKHYVLLILRVDGHTLGRQFMSSGEKAHHKFETQRIRGPDGATWLHALVFDTPHEVELLSAGVSARCSYASVRGLDPWHACRLRMVEPQRIVEPQRVQRTQAKWNCSLWKSTTYAPVSD